MIPKHNLEDDHIRPKSEFGWAGDDAMKNVFNEGVGS